VKIVLLTTLVPTGPPSGGVYATLEINRVLSTYGTVDRWAVWNLEHTQPATIEWRGALRTSLGRLRRHGVLRALSHRAPLAVTRFYRRDLRASLANLSRVDLLFVDHVAMWQYAAAVQARRRVIYSHNVEAEIYQRAVTVDRSLWKRAVWSYEAAAMERYEGAALRGADAVLCAGTRDWSLLRDRYGVSGHVWYPPVASARPVSPKTSRGMTVGSVGTMTWQPNRWGMDWFIRDVWPLVLERFPAARLRLAGRGSEELPYGMIGGVERLGTVSDIHTFFEGLDVVVAPVCGGAGIKVKVMDAAARGLPVVTTPVGTEGLGSRFPFGIKVADTSEDFAACVCSFLHSRPHLPIPESVRWYDELVRGSAAAIDAAIDLPR
jgi:glycosyltransferase involved in cell wall biosynthesis